MQVSWSAGLQSVDADFKPLYHLDPQAAKTFGCYETFVCSCNVCYRSSMVLPAQNGKSQ